MESNSQLQATRQENKWSLLVVVALTTLPLLVVCSPPYPFLHHYSQGSRAALGYGRNIRPLPCATKSGDTGVCMFAWDCMKANGTHLGTCIDRFYFGSCCKLKPGSSKPVHTPMKTGITIKATTTTAAPIQTLPTDPDSENEIIDSTVSAATPAPQSSASSNSGGLVDGQETEGSPPDSSNPYGSISTPSISDTGNQEASFQAPSDGTQVQEQETDQMSVDDLSEDAHQEEVEKEQVPQPGIAIIFPDSQSQVEVQQESGSQDEVTQEEQTEQSIRSELESAQGESNIETDAQTEQDSMLEIEKELALIESGGDDKLSIRQGEEQPITPEESQYESVGQVDQQEIGDEQSGHGTQMVESPDQTSGQDEHMPQISQVVAQESSKPVEEESTITSGEHGQTETTENVTEEEIGATESSNTNEDRIEEQAENVTEEGIPVFSVVAEETTVPAGDQTDSVGEGETTSEVEQLVGAEEVAQTTEKVIINIEGVEFIPVHEGSQDGQDAVTDEGLSVTTEEPAEKYEQSISQQSIISGDNEQVMEGEESTSSTPEQSIISGDKEQVIEGEESTSPTPETTEVFEEVQTESSIVQQEVETAPEIQENLIVPADNELLETVVQEEQIITEGEVQDHSQVEQPSEAEGATGIDQNGIRSDSAVENSQTESYQEESDINNVNSQTQQTVTEHDGINELELGEVSQIEDQPAISDVTRETTTETKISDSVTTEIITTIDDGQEEEITTSMPVLDPYVIVPGVQIVQKPETDAADSSPEISQVTIITTGSPMAYQTERPDTEEIGEPIDTDAEQQETTTEVVSTISEDQSTQSSAATVGTTEESIITTTQATSPQNTTEVSKPDETGDVVIAIDTPLANDTKPGVEKPDVEKPDVEKPDVEKPDVEKPDVEKPDIEKPDVGKPDVEKPDVGKPDVEKPDVEKPDVEKPDVGKPDVEKPDVGKPESIFVTQEDQLLTKLNNSKFTEICGQPVYPSKRIVGGAQASFGEWPWQVSLRQWRSVTYLHKCGAALVNENWAITAAHCVENTQPDQVLLRLGEYDLERTDEPYGHLERKVQIIATHPQFDPRTFEYDLALLRFNEPISFQPNIIPICIPETDYDFIGDTGFVSGWGRLYEDGPLPSVMQKVPVPVITNAECEVMYRHAGYIEDIPNIFICAGYEGGKRDSCEGDSGGPLVISHKDRWQLSGVISWGIGCALPNQPGVYTRISAFREWINKIIVF